jgi:hypothetical protein
LLAAFLITALLIGLIVGAIVRLLLPGRDQIGSGAVAPGAEAACAAGGGGAAKRAW